MTDMTPAARAREAATHFEAKKTGFGQAQDGWSLTLRIQDADVPAFVRDAKKGTRYMIALVEIGDDEQPVSRPSPPAAVERPEPVRPPDSVPAEPARANKERRKFDEIAPAQQAGIFCNEVAFHKFLQEKFKAEWMRCDDYNDQRRAANVIREICEVNSRSEITPHNALWSALVLKYRLWQREPEFIGAA